MKLSLVVCSYNQAPYLRQALASLVAQRRVGPEELELIVIDGGSKDGSVEIIRDFEPRLAYWVSERDRGQSDALRKGFDRATGDVQGWLCSDDELEPDAARTVLDYFGAHPRVRWVYGDASIIDEKGRTLKPKKEIPFNWFIWLYDYNYLPQPSTFWRADLYAQSGGIDVALQVAMDGDLWARFAELSPPRHIPARLSRMRMQPDQKTQELKEESIRAQNKIAIRYGVRHDRKLQRQSAFLLAKTLRVGWKLATGCYW